MEQKKKLESYKPLKYLGYAIVCEEVPDEISIAFNISGCDRKCNGCHSKYLWKYEGNYLKDDYDNLLTKYKDLITCVCFLGGDQNIEELCELCHIAKSINLKTCIYSGEESDQLFSKMINDNLIDYLKIGKYKSDLGGLNVIGTNQKMYKIENKTLKDITYKFQTKSK